MPPAFSSTKQAAAFVLLVLVLLLLPAIAGKWALPPADQSYDSIDWTDGPIPYMEQQIFEEKGDIDIAFIGSSRMLGGIDTPYVQQKLSEKLGRPAVVRSICWLGSGFDSLYFNTKQLLEHRKVHMLVFNDENNVYGPIGLMPYWFRWGDDAAILKDLPLEQKAWFYFASVAGMPRNLLCLLRPNIPAHLEMDRKNYMETYYHAPNPALRLGSLSAELGCSYGGHDYLPFTPFVPRTGATPADVCIYSQDTSVEFGFTGSPTPAWKAHFAREFAKKAQEHGTKLVMIQFPTLTDDPASSFIPEREFWPTTLGADVSMIGIPSSKLFGGLTLDEIRELFYNAPHLNKNGQEYFTPLITPSLLQAYDSAVKSQK